MTFFPSANFSEAAKNRPAALVGPPGAWVSIPGSRSNRAVATTRCWPLREQVFHSPAPSPRQASRKGLEASEKRNRSFSKKSQGFFVHFTLLHPFIILHHFTNHFFLGYLF